MLTVGTDTYVTMAEAVALFERRLRTEAWDRTFEFYREKALKHAALLLEGLPWSGEKTDADQALAFPRDGSTAVPQQLKDAQAELALCLLASALDRGMTAVSGIGGVGIGDDDTDERDLPPRYLPPPSLLARSGATFHDLPAQVQNLIADYVALGVRLTR